MSSSNYPFIIPSDSDIEDIFSSTNTPDYTPASPNYFHASPGSTSSSSENGMAPKRSSTSAAPAMTQAAIKKLVTDSVAATLEAQAAIMENANNTSRNTREREAPIARKCSYKEFIGCQPFNFKGTEGAGNDLKTYMRKFNELATLCPNMVPNNKKLMKVFIGGFPQSIEGTVTASKPQTLKDAINIAQGLLNQVLKHGSVQGTNDHKRKFDNRRNTITTEGRYSGGRGVDGGGTKVVSAMDGGVEIKIIVVGGSWG
uniref:Reverse transcriptase domain-containing protein n=1 Tax=Tanacetum cinerariifolium TaxID=118510 RepID=A0A699J6W0_TANCI|nr:reverse transcriptase domain-containing protein [Tanacetum cinerariifolium]